MSETDIQIALTFDFDAMSPWLQVTTDSPAFISRGEFGPIGVARIRAILDEFDIKGSFFTPGHTALAYPETVYALVEDGHEIGHHGWVHEMLSPLSESEERNVIERGIEALKSVSGMAPRGFRGPGFDLSHRTVGLLVEYGFSYDSSMMARDFSPYWCRSGDKVSASEPFEFGDLVDLVELPVAWHLNDMTFFEFVPGVMGLFGAGQPRDVLDIWRDEFSYLCQLADGGSLVLTTHPQTIGRGHRITMLRDFIEFVLEEDRARFVRADTIAERFRAATPLG